MNSHFKKLSPGEAERLAVFVEECGSCIVAASKVLRHGYNVPANTFSLSKTDTASNRRRLETEMSHLLHAAERLMKADLDYEEILNLADCHDVEDAFKSALHHQPAEESDEESDNAE